MFILVHESSRAKVGKREEKERKADPEREEIDPPTKFRNRSNGVQEHDHEAIILAFPIGRESVNGTLGSC